MEPIILPGIFGPGIRRKALQEEAVGTLAEEVLRALDTRSNELFSWKFGFRNLQFAGNTDIMSEF